MYVCGGENGGGERTPACFYLLRIGHLRDSVVELYFGDPRRFPLDGRPSSRVRVAMMPLHSHNLFYPDVHATKDSA